MYTLKGGEWFTIENLPYNVSYEIVETQFFGYDDPLYDADAEAVSITGAMDDPSISHTITNNRDTTVDTGISLDSLPYVLILAGALVGMGVLVMRRRRNASF